MIELRFKPTQLHCVLFNTGIVEQFQPVSVGLWEQGERILILPTLSVLGEQHIPKARCEGSSWDQSAHSWETGCDGGRRTQRVPPYQESFYPKLPFIPQILLEHPLCVRQRMHLSTPALDRLSVF